MSGSANRGLLPGPSQRAVKILLSAFWGPQGWQSKQAAPDDFAAAMAERVMFAPAEVTHDELVAEAKRLGADADERAASDAFLASLTTRRVDLRSALGSLHVAQALPMHAFVPKLRERACAVCGWDGRERTTEDLNILSFERFKWGGVRRLDPRYAGFDLARFRELPRVTPTPDDLRVARQMICALKSAANDAKATAAVLPKALKGVFPSNDAERRIVIEILSHCGIIQPGSTTPFSDRWTDYFDRPWPPGARNDWAFPVYAWHGKDGINEDALLRVFPQLS
jgi:hypothetical protein